MRARSMSRLAQGAEDDRGVEGRHYRLPSLVLGAAGQAAAGPGLLQGVTGQDPVANRRPGVKSDPGQPVSDGVTDVVEVGRAAADHRAEAGDGVVAAGQL